MENIKTNHEYTDLKTVELISKDAKTINESLRLSDRIEDQSDKTAFITLKDHKEDFLDKPNFRLINPAKTQIGKISKQILKKLNKEIRSATELQQWRSTDQTLDWFKNLKDKGDLKFIQLDIVEYYPSITEETLEKALNFANIALGKQISDKTIEIVKHSRNSFLYTIQEGGLAGERTPWKKKRGLFDVTMGAPDGAEVC